MIKGKNAVKHKSKHLIKVKFAFIPTIIKKKGFL